MEILEFALRMSASEFGLGCAAVGETYRSVALTLYLPLRIALRVAVPSPPNWAAISAATSWSVNIKNPTVSGGPQNTFEL
jgi:hypothetical protein